MARPAKSTNVTSKHLTKAEIAARTAAEAALRGDGLPKPPAYLTKEQKRIFKRIVSLLEGSGTLGMADVYVLTTAAVAIDRLQYIETNINEDPAMLTDKEFMAAKDKYTKDFFRCCNELCLSPQSRAKMAVANMNAAKDAADPLTQVLKELSGDAPLA